MFYTNLSYPIMALKSDHYSLVRWPQVPAFVKMSLVYKYYITFFLFSGICLVQEMVQYPVLTMKRKLLILLGLWYVVVGVFLFADSEVFAIMQDIKGGSLYWSFCLQWQTQMSVSHGIQTVVLQTMRGANVGQTTMVCHVEDSNQNCRLILFFKNNILYTVKLWSLWALKMFMECNCI